MSSTLNIYDAGGCEIAFVLKLVLWVEPLRKLGGPHLILAVTLQAFKTLPRRHPRLDASSRNHLRDRHHFNTRHDCASSYLA